MDGMQMYTVLSQEKTTSPYFQGVYSRDTLPPLEENMCAIVNSDDSSQPGTHWLALFVNDKRELEFYDSFGQPPVFYNISTTTTYLDVLWNSKVFQSPTSNVLDLKIKLIRSKPEVCLQGSEGFKVVLDHVSLFIRKVRVNPGVILGHAKALEKTSAKYPINRVLCKVYSIPKGSMSFIQDNIFSGQMPKKLFVGCVDNEAFHGAFSKSPYEFKHFNLNFIGVYVDGQPVPHNPLELDFLKINTYGPIKLYLLGQIEWVKTEVYLFLEKNIKIQIHCLDLTSHRIYVLQENI
ncbi:uncharacterized protein F54H12.2 [Trichonephila clavipes]|nr:uncharacterized protein F54H12.2 [Trichonephila clavipes]